MTLPCLTRVEYVRLTLPSVQRFEARSARACATVLPFTFGTTHGGLRPAVSEPEAVGSAVAVAVEAMAVVETAAPAVAVAVAVEVAVAAAASFPGS